MRMIKKMVSLGLLIGGLWTVSGALAAASESISKDAVCTKCHDENETKPVLAIYQTKHGVKGDSRTPSCTRHPIW